MASSPELVLFNGNIHTQDAAHPHATAVAVGDGHILACGIDKDILALAGSATRTIDLAQRLVLPGFIDTHFHFYDWALNCNSIDFAPVTSFAGMEAAIREKTRALAPGQWILGQGFNESDWPENRMPHRRDLDRVAPDHPVCIWRCDLHLAVANSLALQLAGIDRHTPDPVGGIIEKDGNGVPTGVLKELAPNRIRAAVPELTREQLLSNLEKRMAQAHALGITGIHDVRLMEDANGGEALRAWQILQNREKLALRCMVTLPGEMTDQAVELGLCTGLGDDFLRIGHLKFFADGGMGARTAWVTEPYLDAPGMGMPLTPVAEIQRAVARADRAGLSCMVHAVGDRACREVLDIYARVAATGQSHCTIAHRVEHAQMILPQDLERLGRIPNLAVSCQPANMSIDISMIDQCAGDRGRHAYNLKGILDSRVPLMLSSDAPVADPDPFTGIYAAVTRKRLDGTPRKGWYREQALTVAQAVRAYTLTPAMASGWGNVVGSISPGKRADMVVMDRDIFTIAPEEILGTTVEMTLFNGCIVHG